MACQFNGADQGFSLSSVPAGVEPMTWCARISATGGSVQTIIGAANSATAWPYYALRVDGDFFALAMKRNSAQASATAKSSAASGVGQWTSIGAMWGETNSRKAFIDTAIGTQETNIPNPTTLTNTTIGFLSNFNGNSGFFAGLIAECAIWSAALTDAEINSLAKGFKPSRIRPQSLVFYAPMVRAAIDVRKGITLTPVNGPTVAAHPRVY